MRELRVWQELTYGQHAERGTELKGLPALFHEDALVSAHMQPSASERGDLQAKWQKIGFLAGTDGFHVLQEC